MSVLFPQRIVFVKNRQELGKSNITSSRIKPLNYCLYKIIEVFWLTVQGLHALIAISSLVVMLVTTLVRILHNTRGDDAMDNKVTGFINMSLDILYTMSANLVSGVLLAKAFQLE